MIRTSPWEVLEKWTTTTVSITGGLFFITVVNNDLDFFTPVPTQEGILLSIEGAAGFDGVVFSFFAVLGLYPRRVGTTPRLAKAGISLALLPGAFFFGL